MKIAPMDVLEKKQLEKDISGALPNGEPISDALHNQQDWKIDASFAGWETRILHFGVPGDYRFGKALTEYFGRTACATPVFASFAVTRQLVRDPGFELGFLSDDVILKDPRVEDASTSFVSGVPVGIADSSWFPSRIMLSALVKMLMRPDCAGIQEMQEAERGQLFSVLAEEEELRRQEAILEYEKQLHN